MAPRMYTSPKRRIDTDVMKLLMNDYEVEMINDNLKEFYVYFKGPSKTPFEHGTWKIHVEIPEDYPFKSPSIGFTNKVYHPNIDELSGSVCLDVINQTWSPVYELLHIFETFLPQLLQYPNPLDPLNGEAAALFLRDSKGYEYKVREYVGRYASGNPLNGNEKSANGKFGSTTELNGEDDDDDTSTFVSISSCDSFDPYLPGLLSNRFDAQQDYTSSARP